MCALPRRYLLRAINMRCVDTQRHTERLTKRLTENTMRETQRQGNAYCVVERRYHALMPQPVALTQ